MVWRATDVVHIPVFQPFGQIAGDVRRAIVAWLGRADWDGSLAGFLDPNLTPPERSVARVEGWILGVPGLIRDEDGINLN
jgi:hypothetical protein